MIIGYLKTTGTKKYRPSGRIASYYYDLIIFVSIAMIKMLRVIVLKVTMRQQGQNPNST